LDVCNTLFENINIPQKLDEIEEEQSVDVTISTLAHSSVLNNKKSECKTPVQIKKLKKRVRNGHFESNCKRFQCKKCSRQYKKRSNFENHKCPKRLQKLMVPNFYECFSCEQHFLTKKQYDTHRVDVHGYILPPLKHKYFTDFNEFRDPILMRKGNYKCRCCDFKAELRSDVFEHYKACKKVFRKQEVLTCPTCNFVQLLVSVPHLINYMFYPYFPFKIFNPLIFKKLALFLAM